MWSGKDNPHSSPRRSRRRSKEKADYTPASKTDADSTPASKRRKSDASSSGKSAVSIKKSSQKCDFPSNNCADSSRKSTQENMKEEEECTPDIQVGNAMAPRRIRFEEDVARQSEAKDGIAAIEVPVLEDDASLKEDLPEEVMEMGIQILRKRLCDLQAAPVFLPGAEENQRKLSDLLTNTIEQACNNSALLLGPRGCGKSMVLEHVLKKMQNKFPDGVSIVRLNGLLHADDRCALKEIAKQLCVEHALEYSKVASFNENLNFLNVVLKECALSQRALVVVLDEFDLFAQKSKQSLLYNLLNVLQSSSSQAAIIGISSRLDADQLLEKRVRSRFSQRKILFLPPSSEEITRFLESLLSIPVEPSAAHPQYAKAFNTKISALLRKENTKEFVTKVTSVELSPRYIIDTIFWSVCDSLRDLKLAVTAFGHSPTVSSLTDLSVLELCLLASMKRLEANKECDAYNFTLVFREYKQLQDVHKSDCYTKQAALKAFEHLLERELITYLDGKSHCSMSQVRPVKMLISFEELDEGLENSPVCPTILRQWCK